MTVFFFVVAHFFLERRFTINNSLFLVHFRPIFFWLIFVIRTNGKVHSIVMFLLCSCWFKNWPEMMKIKKWKLWNHFFFQFGNTEKKLEFFLALAVFILFNLFTNFFSVVLFICCNFHQTTKWTSAHFNARKKDRKN